MASPVSSLLSLGFFPLDVQTVMFLTHLVLCLGVALVLCV